MHLNFSECQPAELQQLFDKQQPDLELYRWGGGGGSGQQCGTARQREQLGQASPRDTTMHATTVCCPGRREPYRTELPPCANNVPQTLHPLDWFALPFPLRFAKLLNQLDLLFMDMARALGMAPQHPNGTLTRDSKPEDIRCEAGGGSASGTVRPCFSAHL